MLKTEVSTILTRTAEFVYVPTTAEEYDRLVALLNDLIDIVRDDEGHPLAKIMEVIGVLIEDNENRQLPEPEGKFSPCVILTNAHIIGDTRKRL